MTENAEPAADAIPRLLKRHGGQIYGLGLKLCRSPEEAEDLVQETFLQAFRRWHQFEGRSAPSTWLYRIAARQCLKHHRRRVGEPARLEPLSLLPAEDEPVVDVPTPEDVIQSRESREAMERALGALPARFRLPLVLKDLLELSVEEVARILGVKPATVKTRVHRARLFLAKELRRSLPRTDAPPRDHSRQMCLDLLEAKQEAMDRRVPFPIPQSELCQRCRSLFLTLDLAHDTCQRLTDGKLPEPLQRALVDRMRT